MADEPGLLDRILAEVAALIAAIGSRIADAVKDLFAPAANQVFSFFNGLIHSLESQLSNIGGFINSIIDQVLQSASDVIGQVADFAKGLFDAFLANVQEVFTDITDWFKNVGNAVLDYLKELFSDVGEWLQLQTDKVFSAIDGFIETAKQFAIDTYTTVKDFLAGLFNDAIDGLRRAGKLVDDFISDNLAVGRLVLADLEAATKRFSNDVVDEIGTRVNDLIGTVADLPEVLTALKDDLIASAKENIAAPLEELATNLIDRAVAAFSEIDPTAANKARELLIRALSGNLISRDAEPEVIQRLEDSLPDQPVLRQVTLAIASMIMAIQTPIALAQIGTQQVVYGHSLTNPWQRLQLQMLAVADRRGALPAEYAQTSALEQGYSVTDYQAARELTRTIAPAGEMLQWFYRGLIDVQQLQQALEVAGYDVIDIPKIIAASELIPPVQDLITMAVREAFSPAIAEQFGQFQDFPEAFAEHASRQGLTGEWARRYWAAHWGLPSPQMGFEMLHRGIIDKPTLELLLRALDVMPFWRDKVIQLSFSPYTRVDIRRMHKVGVLSDAEVLTAHFELGYNEDKARKLTEFVIKLNSPDDDDAPAKAKQLQQATILKFFRDGIFSADKGIELLERLGYSRELAAILINHAAIEDAAAERKADIDLIIEQAKAGVLTFAQAQTELGRVGAEQGELQKALAQILRATKSQSRLPSRAELDNFAKLGLIDPGEYIFTLQLLGYSEHWAKLFAAAIGAKQDAQAKQ